LLAEGQLVTAVTYLGGSLLVGLCAVWLGIASARMVAFGWPRRRRRRHPEQSTIEPTDHQVRNS
jgi:CrcB protein